VRENGKILQLGPLAFDGTDRNTFSSRVRFLRGILAWGVVTRGVLLKGGGK